MTSRKIIIRSELMLQRPIESNPSDKTIWINVRSPMRQQPIKVHKSIHEIPPQWRLYLQFEDIQGNIPGIHPFVLFDAAMADRVVQFTRQDWDILLINCEAGVSRSSAIALATAEAFGLPSPIDEAIHSPNPLVLGLLRVAFLHPPQTAAANATTDRINRLP
ncbi:MAG: hypothetical protein ACRC62_23000 [Microcoleus sp.]